MFIPKTNILVPGKGYVDLDAVRVQRAIQEYDERLHFGFNETNGDWVIYVIMERGSESSLYVIDDKPAWPVIGFGETIPSPEEAITKLRASDTRIHGDKILKDMEKHNEGIKREHEDKADDAAGQMAEGLEWANRKLGTHPSPRIFVPGKS